MEFNFTKFEKFWESIKKFNIDEEVKRELENLINGTGKEIDLNDENLIFTKSGIYYILDDGTLSKQTLYISDKDIKWFNSYVADNINIKELPKYHIYNCATLSEMKNNNRMHRYKISLRKDGTFYFIFVNGKEVVKKNQNQKLEICGHCLNKFNSIHKKDYYKNNFNLNDFFKTYNNYFRDIDIDRLEYDYMTIPKYYSDDWFIISSKMKQKRDYICEKCYFKPKNKYEKRFIHTHHINGDKTNNGFDNLKVLCIKCHSEEFNHSHIKNYSNYQEFLKIKKE